MCVDMDRGVRGSRARNTYKENYETVVYGVHQEGDTRMVMRRPVVIQKKPTITSVGNIGEWCNDRPCKIMELALSTVHALII